MENNSIFEHFRRQKSGDSKAKTHPKIYFQIDFDEYGAYLAVVDGKGKKIEVSYLGYSGAVRNILRSIEQITEKNSFVIDWEKPVERIYLAEHDHLVDLLKRTLNVVDKDMEALTFSDALGQLAIQLTKEENIERLATNEPFWKSEVQVIVDNQRHNTFQLLNEETVCIGQQIIDIQPLGSGFKNLTYFKTEIKESDTTVFFSLLFSYLDNITLSFADYQVIYSEEKIYARPSLVFEKVDVDDSLFMRVGQSLPDLSVSVLEQFDLFKYAEINELEKQITVKYIEQDPLEEVTQLVSKLLKKHTPRKKKEERTIVVFEDGLFIIPREVASGFIYNELVELLTQFQVFGAEKLKSYKISTNPPKVNMNLSHSIDFLEGSVDLSFGEEKVDLFDAIAQLRKNNYIKLSDGTHALMNDAYVKKLERIFRKKEKGKVELSFFDLPLVEEMIEEKVTSKQFKKSREIFEGFNTIGSKKYTLPKLNATLRPYQKDGFKWIQYLQDNNLGGCLADDMGLGKTLQTIAILAKAYPKEKLPSLIVMPRSLLFNWRSEVEKFAPHLTTYTYYGTSRNSIDARKHHLIFTTYALMRNDIETFQEEDFFYVILDESQNIKNLQAQTTKAAMLLSGNHRLALSGTPIENNLGELYSLFRFLNPSMFGTVHQFNQNYLTPIQKDNDKAAIRQLRKKIFPFILRRLKKDVLKDLPDKIEQTLFIEMSEKQRKLYESRRSFYKTAIETSIATKGMGQSRFFIFQALNELRQIASTPEKYSEGKIVSPKRELLQEQLMDTVANGHKALVFVNFLATIELIADQLEEVGIGFVSMTGATRDRQALVNRFQNDPNCKVFVMTLKTGGTGLNLTAADNIFIFDPWWNVAAENQAIDRAHRIGQKNKVLAYKLITEGSIEEKIMKLQQMKKELFDNVISSDGASLKALSAEDIDFILS